MESQNPPLRLAPPFFKDPSLVQISAYLPQEIYDYFFVHLLAGPKGPINTLTQLFYKELHRHCTQDQKLPTCYDEDGTQKMAKIMSRLNFNDPESLPSSRRTNPRPPKPSPESPSGNSLNGGTPPSGQKSSRKSRKAPEKSPNHPSKIQTQIKED